MSAQTLMVMGTSSSVGKSLLTAALCRIFRRRGVRVAPFKAQNMSNNAAVCADGAEIGRAQAVQAQAARIEPCADMNPVLLKPEGATRSQVIVLGKPWETLQAARYYERKSVLWPIITAALDRLLSQFDLVIIEGAGSPVELNLKNADIVNMAVAQYAQSPVLLVGDIDKGGIFAQLLGTLWLLPASERALVRGLIVNKFRGDFGLFADGVRILEARGDIPVLGVVPFLKDLGLPEEDAVALATANPAVREKKWDIAIVHLPHIANFDDFDPLVREPSVCVRYVAGVSALGCPHAIIVPGTKSTMADLAWLRERGFDRALRRAAHQGGAVVGICGGFQMLGRVIHDAQHMESSTTHMAGLGLLPVETSFARTKITQPVQAEVQTGPGWLRAIEGQKLAGYEIHLGRTWGSQPWLQIFSALDPEGPRPDGAASPDGRIWGCYLHGLFANDVFRRHWLKSLSVSQDGNESDDLATTSSWDIDVALDHLADEVEASLDMPRILALV